MSLETPPETYETSNQYLTAYLMLEGFHYEAVEYRQGRNERWYSWFLFEVGEALTQRISEFERRTATGNIQSFIDCLSTVKDTLRQNRNRDGVDPHAN